MPQWRTVYDWLDVHEEFSAGFARARKLGFDAIAEEAMRIANTPVLGEEVEINEAGQRKVKTGDMLGHRKLQIETRLKLLAKWDPKRYGERLQTELTGADGGPVKVVDETAAASRAASLLALAQQRKDEAEG